MAAPKPSSSNHIFSSVISGTPTITSKKLNVSNYTSWSASVQLWFMGQGLGEYLTKKAEDIPKKNQNDWKKVDVQLCAVLW